MHGAILTSWPADLATGSGTALFVNALTQALQAAGWRAELYTLPSTLVDSYAKLLAARIGWNARMAHAPEVADCTWVLGLDYDGYGLPHRRGQTRIASARALFAEIVATEPEPLRSMLTLQAALDDLHFRQVDMVTVPSAYAAQAVQAYHRLPADRVHVIANGIDLVEWDALLASAPARAHTRPVLLAVSKLYPRKRLDAVLRALPAVRESFPDVELRVAGGGFAWDMWRQLAHDLNVSRAVTWLGDLNRAAVAAEFAGATVFVHPSIQETFGNVCLEAMGARVPLVVSAGTAPAELVGASGAGLTVPIDDPEAMAEALCALLSDAERRAALGVRGRTFAEAHPWGRAAAAYMDLIGSLTGVAHEALTV
ncbi:MAG TPA: glycosyltransferase family 4 protein [Anaerolineales bacterium]|nr:glycosyltransferase family 4 protein [Anaerolineales bacterium]